MMIIIIIAHPLYLSFVTHFLQLFLLSLLFLDFFLVFVVAAVACCLFLAACSSQQLELGVVLCLKKGP